VVIWLPRGRDSDGGSFCHGRDPRFNPVAGRRAWAEHVRVSSKAPEVTRTRPAGPAAERESLQAWLDYHRATLLLKCQGLTGEQLARRAVSPSSLSLLGLVRHMAECEGWWFRRHFRGQTDLAPRYCTDEFPDGDFDLAEPGGAEADFAAFAQEVQLAREATTGRSLDNTFRGPRGDLLDLRWAYVHMIEEYARHNGHADLLRERIDGVTGD